MSKAERAAQSRAAAILGAMGGRVVTEKKRKHLRSIAKAGAAARWGTKAKAKRTTKAKAKRTTKGGTK